MRSIVLALITLCLLTACDTTQSLKELRVAPVASDPYQQALAEGYKQFAEVKVANYDWWTSKYFADKGLMAAYGRDTQPEDPKNWDIPATMLPTFEDARRKLLAAVALNKTTQPVAAAAAVVTYDRWVEVQNNQWDVAKIEETRDAFYAALGKLSEAHPAETATPPEPVESTSTILYFPFDSDKLGDSANNALAELVRYIQSAGNVSITINGHADRAGTEAYNMDLSERRAKFVMKALEAAGVPAKIMKYFAFGETDPAVPTADGVAEPKNRRVEIFIE
jgi:OOP family OmpA-OmpF porin